MSDLTAEVRIVVHPHDQPTATITEDQDELAVHPTGHPELILYLTPPDAERWLQQMTSAIHAATAQQEPLTEPAER